MTKDEHIVELEEQNKELRKQVVQLKCDNNYLTASCLEVECAKKSLREQIEKMKCCQNCSHLCSRCELGIDGCYVCSKWELRR